MAAKRRVAALESDLAGATAREGVVEAEVRRLQADTEAAVATREVDGNRAAALARTADSAMAKAADAELAQRLAEEGAAGKVPREEMDRAMPAAEARAGKLEVR